MFKNNINYIIHATPHKKNYIVNYAYNVKINLFILTLFLTINLSCVENTITIHILPDGQTFLQIVSTGDSTDIIDGDFEHPMYEDQSSSYKVIKSDSVWKAITKIILKDSIFNLKPDYGLSYNFKIQKSASSISNIHRFKMNFIGREIKTEYPLLYKAIKSNNLDNKLSTIKDNEEDLLWLWKDFSDETKQLFGMVYFQKRFLRFLNHNEFAMKIYNYYVIM